MKSSISRYWVRVLAQRQTTSCALRSTHHIGSWACRGTFSRSLNIFTVFSKEARDKEQARLKDELNRGYFDDLRDLKKTGGKVAIASLHLVPIAAAPKFPSLVVQSPLGDTLTLPIEEDVIVSSREGDKSQPLSSVAPTIVCIAFRASAQSMVESWSIPFSKAFQSASSVQLFEVSVIEPWVLSLPPIKSWLLRSMRISHPPAEGDEVLNRRAVYAFGDTYFFRKTLGIPNLMSGYVFLLDRKGRVRWRASGMATTEELGSMVSCTSRLLEEEAPNRS